MDAASIKETIQEFFETPAGKFSMVAVPVLVMGIYFLFFQEASDEMTGSKSRRRGRSGAPKATKMGTAEEAAERQKAALEWSYSPVGKRDPFRSYLAEKEAMEEDENAIREAETEKFELDQYQLTALITGTAQPAAMVEDPAGKGHVVRIGTRLGKNGGRVTRIMDTGIVVTEETRAPTGERIRVPITILLPKPEWSMMKTP